MPEKLTVENKDIRGSQFRHLNMSETVFEDIDLSGAKFFNTRRPVVFNSIELDDCTIQNSYFRNTKIVNCDLTGMTIDGVLVTDMVKAYKRTK
jgi:uncharacterized protein YjbI with pentapeptide repeats